MTNPRTTGGRWLYPFLLGVQTIGVLIVYWQGLPLYREILAAPAAYRPRVETWEWSIAALVLIQTGYWLSYRLNPAKPRLINAALGHVVEFFGRLCFLLPSAAFSFLVIANRTENRLPFSRAALLLTGLFSCYCYMLEMRRFGTHMMRREDRAPSS
jgi:hypothetical protein